jgi:AcrR family transcriptional regulator
MAQAHHVPRVGRPPRSTRGRVIEEARRIGAKEGLDGLTMRRLAVALDVMPNALYTYFPDKAAILDAVLDDLLGDVRRRRPTSSWRADLISFMASYRQLLLSNPGLIALTVSRPMIGINAMRLREEMLDLLRRGIPNDTDVVTAYLALFAYTTGYVSFEAGRTPGERDAQQRARARRLFAALPDEAFPNTRALAGRLAKRPGDAEFIRGLRRVLEGFAGKSGRT